MRKQSSIPSCQLGSMAGRYCHPLAQAGRGFFPRHPAADLALSQAALDSDGRDPRLGRLEAVLFLAHEPLTSRKLAQLASLADGTQARTLVRQLNDVYDTRGRAFRVEEVAGGYQLRTRPQFASWVRRMVGAPPEIRMSGPAMETLAVVAYRQPVLRAEIEAIRGVQCGEILRQLMERGMVRISGRAHELGRPFLYGTTRNFLQVFGLRSLDELPRASMLRKSYADVSAAFDGEQQEDEAHPVAVGDPNTDEED